jgi:hypothetical protein
MKPIKIEVTGLSLKDYGMDNIYIVSSTGKEERKLEGFVGWEGQTLVEAMIASLVEGEQLIYKFQPA